MKRIALGFLIALALISCATTNKGGRVHISDIKKNPSAYEGKTITLEGEVVSSLAVMGGLFQIYEAYSDDTLWIKVGEGQELPKVRTFVRVRGNIDSGFRILNQNYGTVLLSRDIQDLTPKQ